MYYRNLRNGAKVSVRDDKEMNPQVWEVVEGPPPSLEAEEPIQAVEEEKKDTAPAGLTDLKMEELKAMATSLGISFKGNISKAALAEIVASVQSAEE